MHDVDKIVSSCCAETEGLERPKEVSPWQYRSKYKRRRLSIEAHQERHIDRVVDVPVDKQPGDAEDSGSCCTMWYSDVKATINIRPDSVVMIAV